MGEEEKLLDERRVSTDRKSMPTLMRTTLYPNHVVYEGFQGQTMVLNTRPLKAGVNS